MTLAEAISNLSRACQNLALAVPDKRLRFELERAVVIANTVAEKAAGGKGIAAEEYDRGWHLGAIAELEAVSAELFALAVTVAPQPRGASLEAAQLEGYAQGLQRAGQLVEKRALLLKTN